MFAFKLTVNILCLFIISSSSNNFCDNIVNIVGVFNIIKHNQNIFKLNYRDDITDSAVPSCVQQNT